MFSLYENNRRSELAIEHGGNVYRGIENYIGALDSDFATLCEAILSGDSELCVSYEPIDKPSESEVATFTNGRVAIDNPCGSTASRYLGLVDLD